MCKILINLLRLNALEYKTYICLVCGWIYNEELGDQKEGFPPGTRWEEIPDTWFCPECGVGKKDFELVEF